MTRFALDKRHARILGVCAGIADSTGIDLTLVRVATVLTTVLLGPVGLVAYGIAGFCAPARVS